MAPKKKQEKMALGDFLTNQSLGSWADEMDAQPIPSATPGYSSSRDGPSERRAFTQPSWGEGRTERGGPPGREPLGPRGPSYDRPRFDREPVAFPTQPPYTAHLGNLDYNVTSADVEDFLAGCEVTSVRIVEDKQEHKPKGFGYVEFKTPEGLRAALAKSESQFMGRNVKISVADPPKDRPEPTRDFSDWTRRGPLPDLPQPVRQLSSRGFSRNMDNMSDAGSERGGPAGPGGRKPGFFAEDGRSRDLGNWERKGPLSPLPQPGPPNRDGGRVRESGGPRERKQSPSWGEGRSDAGSRPPRREFEPRPPVERTPTAAEADNQWRSKMRPDPVPEPTPEAAPAPPTPVAETPKERPRLNLAKRTVSAVDQVDSSATTPSADSKASPFGAARPIDTAAREREVAEKREVAIRQKKEADDKAKEEKAAREAASRTARAERADRGQAEQDGESTTTKPTAPQSERPERSGPPRRPSRQQSQQNGASRAGQQQQQPASKENGEATAQRPSFSILARDANEADEAGDAEAAGDASANGTIVADKETKPQEPTVVAGAGTGETGTAQALEEDGWSTVPASGKVKGGRRTGGRAVAS